jgi:hypothetical protein
MMKSLPGGALLILVFVATLAARLVAQAPPPPNTDVLGVHDFSAATSPLHGQNANACIYCHAPHNALATQPLWNQTLSTKQYTLFPGATPTPGAAASINTSSMLCLSCHDGTVAVGQTAAIGTLQMTGAFTANLGTNLSGSHPFSIQPQLQDDATLVSALVSSHKTKDPAVLLVNNNVECGTCHDVHNQYKDRKSLEFLVRDNAAGGLCLSCHDAGARTVNGRDNVLTGWPGSAHSNSNVAVAPKAGLGGYTSVSEFACSACHVPHNGLGTALLRNNITRLTTVLPNVDNTSQTCFTCHDGSDNLTQPIANLASVMSIGQKAHPFGDASNQHLTDEPVVLDRNRHATCADCHAPHSAQPTTSFPGTANIRPSQTAVPGVAADGSVLKAATYQYETCLRCHGTSIGKQSLSAFGYMPARGLFGGDTLDISLQFAHGSTSSHPVMRDASNLARPSLLKSMWNVSFSGPSRAITPRILCTDCHNNDNNREFGGTGPNGPHGSRNDHVLERNYLISQVGLGAAAGTTIINLQSSPVLDPVPNSPFALCAKCHDLNFLVTDTTWSKHGKHINQGISCSVCHSAHGVPAGSAGVTGSGMVTFDLNVVGPNNGVVSYSGGENCTLTCHNRKHGS